MQRFYILSLVKYAIVCGTYEATKHNRVFNIAGVKFPLELDASASYDPDRANGIAYYGWLCEKKVTNDAGVCYILYSFPYLL